MRHLGNASLPMLAAAGLLAACGGGAPADGADGLTAAENRQLDEAAERLDAEREAYEAEMAAQARADAAPAAETGASVAPEAGAAADDSADGEDSGPGERP